MSPDSEWPTRAGDTTIIEQTEQRRPPAPPPAPPDEPDGPIGRGMLLALAVIALAVLGALAGWYLTHRSSHTQTTTVVSTTPPGTTTTSGAVAKVSVPQLVGLTQQQALIKLGQAGLKPKLQQRTEGPRDGLVVEQRPSRAETVAIGTPVLILVDRPEAPAVAKPATPKAVPPKPKPSPAPAAQTTTTHTTTTQASTTTTAASTTTPAPTTATMPDLSGKTEQEAAQALDQVGLVPSFVFVPNDAALGSVVQQSKSAGTTLPAKSHTQVNLSTGPGDKQMASVPDLTGKTLSEAVAALHAAGLRLIFLKQPVATQDQAGKVVQQTPDSGEQAPKNAQVLVYLGAFQR